MPRKYAPISCSKSDFCELHRLSVDTADHRLAIRCQMVLRCLDGCQIKDIAAEFHERPNTVIQWRERFASEGIPGLRNRPRGKPSSVYDKDAIGRQISNLLKTPPPDGFSRWNGRLIAERLLVPPHVVWRYLKKHEITLSNLPQETAEPIKHFLLEIPVSISFESKEAVMENHDNNKMNLEIIARITDDDGNVIEKTVRLDKAIPNTRDFDLSTREGFLRDFDALESGIIQARTQIEGQLAAAFMDDAAKKNSGRTVKIQKHGSRGRNRQDPMSDS